MKIKIELILEKNFELDNEGNIKIYLIEECKNNLTEKYFKQIRLNEKNKDLKLIKFDETGDFYYFGETKVNLMNGFGFLCNKNQSEFYLGEFINDVFTNGIWMKNNREVLIGSFYYDYADPIKNNFNGMMLVTRKNENSKGKNYRLNMKNGKFNFENKEFLGTSVNVNEFDEIKVEYSTQYGDIDEIKTKYSLNIFKEKFNEENYFYKIKLENFSKLGELDNYYVSDNTSFYRAFYEDEKEYYFAEAFNQKNLKYRGYFTILSENPNQIFPIFVSGENYLGISHLIDYEKNIKYKGSFHKGLFKRGNCFLNYNNKKLNIFGEFYKYKYNSLKGGFSNGSILENKELLGKYLRIINKEITYGEVLYKNSEYDLGKFKGDIKDNKRHGNGIYEYKSRQGEKLGKYNGEWQNNKRHGKGNLIINIGEGHEMNLNGIWENDILIKS